jgi:hypothetical protein
MWMVLLEANFSKNTTTLGALKKFLFVLECLDSNEISVKMQAMFRNFM